MPARPRAGSRIASTRGEGVGSGSGYGYAYAAPSTGYAGAVDAPEARTIASEGNVAFAVPAVNTTGNVAVWDGDDATFELSGLRLARVNNDLAANLGRGSDRGFLILDTGSRWRGLRAGDVLIEVDGRAVRDGSTARIALDPGYDHNAAVIRDGQKRTVSVELR